MMASSHQQAAAAAAPAPAAKPVAAAPAALLQWSRLKAGSGVRPREGHACAAVPDGGSLLFGGALEGPTETAETVYFAPPEGVADDGTLGVVVETTGVAPAARVSAAAATVEIDGEPCMVVFGGLSMQTGWLGDLHALGMSTLEWRQLQPEGELPSPRDKLGCAAVGSKVYFFGGFGPTDGVPDSDDEEDGGAAPPDAASFTWFNDMYELDTATMRCRKLAPTRTPPTPRAAAAVCACGTDVVVVGGKDRFSRRNDVHVFDTVAGAWSTLHARSDAAPPPASFAACAPLDDRRFVVFGGRTEDNGHTGAASVFDLSARQWARAEFAGDGDPPARGGHTLCASGGWLLLFGGASNYSDEAHACLTRHRDLWLLTERSGAAAAKRTAGDDDDDDGGAADVSAGEGAALKALKQREA